MKQKSKQTLMKVVLSISIIIISVACYFAFGFFFDVMLECIPILLIPVIAIPFVWVRGVSTKCAIALSLVFCMLGIVALGATSSIATSNPGQSLKIQCGQVQELNYSQSFMKNNFDIKQGVKVRIWLPQTYDCEKTYPVVYVLDGDSLFHYTAVKASQLCNESNLDVIVVGVGYGYLNPAFARGGIVYQDTKNVRGRWRDFCFADDTQAGYMPGTIFGGESKRGKEFAQFLSTRLVEDICAKYSVDKANSTLLGHSLGGGMCAYMFTQSNPQAINPFSNFVIVDNGYLDYYNLHLADLKEKLNACGNSFCSTIKVYRIWGGSVNPQGDAEQFEKFEELNNLALHNFENYFWIPAGANHSDTQTIGIDNALFLTLGLPFGNQQSL